MPLLSSPSSPALSRQLRADLFAQLAVMEKSGLSVHQALDLLRMPVKYQPRIAMMRKWLARGSDISAAGYRSGLFTRLDANLVGAAASAGSPASTYKRLAEYYTQRANQERTIKARLSLPCCVLVLGLFVQPLPALFSGAISGGSYLLHAVGSLAAIAVLVFVWLKLFSLHEGPPSIVQTSLGNLAMKIPLFGKMLIRRNIRDFFQSLALMVEAGMPILQAIPKALDTIQLGAVNRAFGSIQSKIERGNTLAQALVGISYLDSGRTQALIVTGEASGSLPEMLFRYADMETSAINDFNQQVAEWLPRIIYAAIAGWIAYGILTGAGVGPNLPAELR
ncbi:MAG TPA: type II secretion system F family protein [Burkholderiaceae bacterium]|jgi:general secretion pathway protein F